MVNLCMAKTWNPALIWFVSVRMILCNVCAMFNSEEQEEIKKKLGGKACPI